MDKKRKAFLSKASAVALGAVLLAAIAYIELASTQSRFVASKSGDAWVFVDKYIDKALRDDFLAGLDGATAGFLREAGLVGQADAGQPVAYFAADRHYGVVGASDGLVNAKLRGRPSSDFVLFRTISHNFYANELVTKSVTSEDGSYVFINLDGHWRAAALHAFAHSLAARRAPDFVGRAMSNSQDFDEKVRFEFRFVDEAIALLASDLMDLAAAAGGVEAAWAAYPGDTALRYGDRGSPVLAREAEIRMVTFDLPQKSAEFYADCNAFATFALGAYGRDAVKETARRFYSGDYESLDGLFSAMGGLKAALTAWKGDAAAPR